MRSFSCVVEFGFECFIQGTYAVGLGLYVCIERGRERTDAYGCLSNTAHDDWADALVSAQGSTSF